MQEFRKTKKQITKLTSENNKAKEKLKRIHTQNKSPLDSGRLKETSLKAFASSQLLDSVMVDSLEEDEKYHKQPDSTQPPLNKDHGTTGSDAGSVFQCSGVVHKKKNRQRINKDSQPPSVRHMSEENSKNKVEKLLKTKADMEVKLKDAQKKLMDREWTTKPEHIRTTLHHCYFV